MAMTFNFNPMDFSRIPEHERQARQNYYSSLEGIGKAMGSAAETLGEAYDGREQRRKKEEADKRQWDNMIAELKYRHGRDAIADARYKEELDRKLKEIEAKNADLDAMKKRVGSMGDEKFFGEKYGPSSAIHYNALMTSRDAESGRSAYTNLANSIMQQQMLNENREQARIAAEKEASANVPDRILAEVGDYAARNNIKLSRTATLPTDPVKLKNLRLELIKLKDYMNNNILHHSIASGDKVREISEMIDAVEAKLNYKKPESEVDAALDPYNL